MRLKRFGDFIPALVILLLLIAMWDQSYNGRQDVVDAQRAGCERGSRNLAAIVNSLRQDEIANTTVASDPRQPIKTRTARSREALEQSVDLLVLDSHIDRGVWAQLVEGIDRDAVRKGGFRCDVAYPPASPFQFFN